MVALALLIFACEDPGEIGLELNPENGLFVAKYQGIPLDNSVILFESMVTDNATRIDSFNNINSGGRLLVGSFENQQFGKFSSKAFAGVYLGKVGFSNESGNYIFDSLIFNIKVDYLYGNSLLGNKRISIHELSDTLDLDTIYRTNNTSPYQQEAVGTFDFDLSTLDTVWIDTVLTTRLSDELGIRFLEEARVNDITFANNNDFRKFFSGFAFVADDMNDMVTGIIPENARSFLRLHFHDTKDTTFLDLIFQDLDTLEGNLTKYYNNITLDRTGTPLQNISDFHTDFETANDLSYIQASTGVFTKMTLQPYFDFLDTVEHLVINRAEIEIPVELYTDNTIPSSPLDIYVIDENNRFIEQFVPGRPQPNYKTIGKLSFKKDPNENTGKYAGDLTQYVQNLTSGEASDLNFLLGQASLWNSVLSIHQSVIKKDEIQLNVYYSTIRQN
jgi:hypothetical protein